jgi:hypothetical protein
VSSLILELQGDALNPSVSALTLLRKALVVAAKLGIEEFQEWIELELNGYKGYPIPEYRKMKGQLRAWNPYHGWQPIITHDQNLLEVYETVCNCSIGQSISELVALVDNAENELQMQMPPWAESFLVASVETSVKVGISSASVKRIVESARDVILCWALRLEKDGITGEGMTFSQQEKQIAAEHDYSYLIQINLEQSQMQNSSSQSQSNSEIFRNENDLRGANVANFANQIQDNAHQVASDFSQSIGQNIDEITRLIGSLREMAQEFPESQRGEAMVHLDDLQEDITTPEKQKPQRFKTRLVALLAIAGTTAGVADFSNNVLELAQKLGVQIEFNQPQATQQLPPSILNQSSVRQNP